MKNLSKYIDHTLLDSDASLSQIEKLCQEAKEYSFCSVCVNSCYVAAASDLLGDSGAKVCSVVGFPLGAMSSKAKAYEAKVAMSDGADEIDMVINVGWLKSGRTDLVRLDIAMLREACKGIVLKVILETSLLNRDEIIAVCKIAREAGVDFVKTSTGFGGGGATVDDVKLMKSIVGSEIGVKASGGVRSYEDAVAMIEAGASRLGASSGVAIINGRRSDKEY